MQHHPSPPGKAVGIWIRVSTEDQVRGESPEHHEKRAQSYADAKGWQVVETYRLNAVSGKAVMAHPEAQRMLSDIRAGRITGLVFSKLARLARNTRELLEFSEIFREQGADLISLQEAIDTSSPAGRLFFTMIAAMAEWERAEIAERVAASVPIRAKLGKPIGGPAPFGYAWVNKRLVPHPEEASVRVLIHELFREHRRKKTVAKLLNDQGYRTRNGSLFSGTTVYRLLLDPTAKGLHRANYTKSDDRSKSWHLKPESEWVYTEVEPIVSVTLWDECVRILQEQGANRKPTRKVVHLFSGLTVCHCGAKMYVPSNSPKYICHQCRNKIPTDDLGAIFHEQLRGFIFSEVEISRYLEANDSALSGMQKRLALLQAEEGRVTAEADKLYDLYLSSAIDKAGFARRNRPLAERLRQLGDALQTAQAELDALNVAQCSQEEIIRGARDLHARWTELPSEDQRRIVEAIVEKITVFQNEVEIELFYHPGASELPPDPEDPDEGGGTPPEHSSSSRTDGNRGALAHPHAPGSRGRCPRCRTRRGSRRRYGRCRSP